MPTALHNGARVTINAPHSSFNGVRGTITGTYDGLNSHRVSFDYPIHGSRAVWFAANELKLMSNTIEFTDAEINDLYRAISLAIIGTGDLDFVNRLEQLSRKLPTNKLAYV